METRAVIEQAKGILVAQQHCTPEQAFELLTRHFSATTRPAIRPPGSRGPQTEGWRKPQAGRPAAQPGGSAWARGAVRRLSLAVSEFGQLGARRHEPHTARTEIHHQGGVNLDADDPAEAVRIVGNQILHGELLGRRSGGWGAEGTGGQEAPGRGAGWFHLFQYAATRRRWRRA
jgi:ANTAR domain